MLGCYVRDNEPSQHVVYMYNWAEELRKTQERIHQTINTK